MNCFLIGPEKWYIKSHTNSKSGMALAVSAEYGEYRSVVMA